MNLRRLSLFLVLAGDLAAAAVHPLARQATIRRDTYGVPHILAETEEAAAFALGYAQAEDHAVQIARRLVSARGEEARHFATGVESDFEMKRFGNYAVARETFPKLGHLFQRMLRAFADGFNLYVEQNRAKLPAWIPSFTAVDVHAQSRAEIMRFAFRRARESIRAIQEKHAPATAPAPRPSAEEEFGSNMWALAPSRTASGKAMLVGNPHQLWSALYWEAHLTVPGKINFFGATFAGLPVLRHGFNERLGWTHTVNSPDLDDIFVLTLDRDKPHHYLFEGKSMPLSSREIEVEIAGKTPQRRTYWYSHLGPVIHRTPEKAFALKSAILDAYAYMEQWYEMGKTKNLGEFLAVLKQNSLPMFNLTYADADGNILYVWNGKVPVRLDDGTDYRLEVRGDTGKYVWSRFHATAELPQLLNPAGGYVQNCNDPPWWTSLRNPLDPKKYPSYFEPGRTLGLRTQMSLAILESRPRFSFEEIRRLKFHTGMLLADRVKPDLVKAARAAANAGEDLKRGLAVLDAWDNQVSSTSRGGVLFQRFWDTHTAAVAQPFAVAWSAAAPARTPSGLADTALALRHMEEAVRWTRQTYGSEDVAWGEVHRFRRGEVDVPASGAPGPYGMFRVMSYEAAADGKRLGNSGDGWIMAVEFSRPVQAYTVTAYGQSSDPASPHHADQLRLFAEHRMKRVWFAESEIRANLERSYHPGGGE